MQVLLIIDEAYRLGINAARLARNASLPAEVQDGTKTVQVQTGTLEDGVTPVMQDQEVPNMVPNPDILATDEAYVQWVMGKAVESYHMQLGGTTNPPPPVGGTINGKVMEVTKRQGVQALINRGKIGMVQPLIDSIPDPVMRATMDNEWKNSQTFQRTRPALIQLAGGLGIVGDDALDEWFQYASTL